MLSLKLAYTQSVTKFSHTKLGDWNDGHGVVWSRLVAEGVLGAALAYDVFCR